MKAPSASVLLFSALAAVAAFPGHGSAQADSRPLPSTPDPQTDSRPVQSAPDPKTDPRPTPSAPDPRTDSTPAPPQRGPDLRADSRPQTAPAAETDSKPYDLGADLPAFLDLGFDPNTVPPAGMIGKSVPGSPLLLYLTLEHRPEGTIAPPDAAVIAARQTEIDHAAALHGFDLKQPGWTYQQTVCPAAEAGAGAGVLVLHFVREAPGSAEPTFTAIVPRERQDVRVIAFPRRKATSAHADLRGGRSRSSMNEAIPAPTLFSHLEPGADWLATAACIAELAGASPHIPNDPDLDAEDRILAAPSPLLRLLLNGDRKVYFTDRENPDHYSIWDEWVEHTGGFKEAQRRRYDSPVLAVTNPPTPPAQPVVVPAEPPVTHPAPVEASSHSLNPAEPPVLPVTQPPLPASITLNPPQPPVVMKPLPPGPLGGERQ